MVCCGCGLPQQHLALLAAFDTTSLTPGQKMALTNRYKFLVKDYYARSWRYSVSFHGLRLTITIGSLIVPALLSVQGAATPSNVEVYWIVWVLSLLVTISNGIMTLLKIDKKYFTLNTTYQLLLSEGWQFVELSGRFSGMLTPGQEATHANQYQFFCTTLEKIRMKHIEDEYYKAPDHGSSHSAAAPTAELIPPTPLKPLAALKTSYAITNGSVAGASATPATHEIRRQNSVGALGTSASAPLLSAIEESSKEGRANE